MSTAIEPTPHTQVRVQDRASYDRQVIDEVLDEAHISHVGIVDGERPVVIPMLHARVEDRLYLHGSPATRLFRSFRQGPMICVTATVLDGLVLARSAFHHSANYRSVVLFGRPESVDDLAERRQVLDLFTDKIVPDRRPHLRPMTDREVRGTAVYGLEITEASAKVRTGPPIDDEDDLTLPIWAGVVPVTTSFGNPEPDPLNLPGLEVPRHVEDWLHT